MSTKEINIEKVISLLIEGKSYRMVANSLGISLSTFYDFLMKPEHSARVKEAKRIAASTYADKAEEVLKDAQRNAIEMTRARELAQHYRWKASKLAPKEYGDKVSLEHTGADGGAIKTQNIDLTKLSTAELDILAKAIGQNPNEPTE